MYIDEVLMLHYNAGTIPDALLAELSGSMAVQTDTTSHNLKDYLEGVSDKVRAYFKRNLDFEPYLDSLRVSVRRLPEVWAWVYQKGRIGIQRIGKILGQYRPGTDRMALDPQIFSRSSPVKPDRVAGEEMIHCVQDKTDAMKRYAAAFGRDARDYIEGAAAYVADKIFGKTDVYPTEKARFERMMQEYGLGLRDAFLGRNLPAQPAYARI